MKRPPALSVTVWIRRISAGIGVALAAIVSTANAGQISFSAPFTDDVSTGISSDNTYTHAISGGAATTVNGVDFELLDAGNFPVDFEWDDDGFGQNAIANNLSTWVPANGGVAGADTISLFQGFTYSGGGAEPDSRQIFTLSGLTPGQFYNFRFYIRVWTTPGGSGRAIDFRFTNGSEEDELVDFQEDRPGTMLGTGNDHNAYYINYAYVAQGEELTIEATVPSTAPANSGSFHMYALTNQEAAEFSLQIDAPVVASSAALGDLAGTLKGLHVVDGEVETAFALVSGDGDDDNGKFQINGNQLQAGAFDFSGAAEGTIYSVRVRGTADGGDLEAEQSFLITVSSDTDSDDLPDSWEMRWGTDLVTLSGLNETDTDSDGLTDLEEYQQSQGEYPDIDPTNADTDGDSLQDGAELAGAGDRPATDPTDADTDADGLSDEVETNTGSFVSASDTGTDPTDPDSDADGGLDGREVATGSNPLDDSSLAQRSEGISFSEAITGAENSGISDNYTYTHAISGGTSVTINGVEFGALTPTETPSNFDWNTNGFTKNQVANNLGDWLPLDGGIDDAEEAEVTQLFRDFTYSGNGAGPGAFQTFTLSGLTPGVIYDFHLYIRVWDTEGSSRPIDLQFQNGSELAWASSPAGLPFDRPGEVIESFNDHEAYYVSYIYTAQSDTLILNALVPADAVDSSGSAHMYAMTNHAVFQAVSDVGTISSSVQSGGTIASLTGELLGAPVPTTFTLIDGAGADDNGKFQVAGQALQAGAHNFAGDAIGTTYTIRLRAATNDGNYTADVNVVLTLSPDSDGDNLDDEWESRWAANLDVLSGLNDADSDGDTLTDQQEFQISLGDYPDIDPTKADTDGDGLSDAAEVAGAGDRAPTSPVDADSDNDGLSDGVESGTGTFASASDTGTDPNKVDTDSDGARDGREVGAGSDPLDDLSVPEIGSASVIAVGPVTDTATSGISDANDYTHAISGGSAVTVNGVEFAALTPADSPASFEWDTHGLAKSQVTDNFGDWIPLDGGLDDAEEPDLAALFRDFTYSSDGANPSSIQSYILSGLTPGATYELRLYIRIWDTDGSSRPIDLEFVNGTEFAYASGIDGLPEDRTGTVLGTDNEQDVLYVSYIYTAQSDSLTVNAQVPASAPANSGSFHLYALTNQTSVARTPFSITDISREAATGSVSLTFSSTIGKVYAIDYATTDFSGDWNEVTDGIEADGAETTFTDTFVAPGQSVIYYRVREL
ncbi:MAG: hypothetical protein R3F19_03520 [Verrucomicrobiales bacterium]